MTDREKLLTALLRESDRRVGAEISVFDVIAMLDQLGAEHRRVVHHEVVLTAEREPVARPARETARDPVLSTR